MKSIHKLVVYALVTMMLFSLVACGGGSGSLSGGRASSNPNVTTMVEASSTSSSEDDTASEGTGSTAGVSIGAEDVDLANVAWEDLSDQDKVYRMIDTNPLMFNGIGPKEFASRRHINKGLSNIPQKDDPLEYVIGFSGGSMSSPYFINLIESTAANTEAFGFTVQTQLNGGNAELRYQQLDAFITQGVNGIMAQGAPPAECEPYFKRAVEAGIPCVSTSSQATRPDNSVITNSISCSFVAGFLVGEYAAHYMVNVASEIRPELADPDYVFQIGHVVFSI